MMKSENDENLKQTNDLMDNIEAFLKNYGNFERLYKEGISLRSQRIGKCLEIRNKLVAKALTEDGKPLTIYEVTSKIGNVTVSVNRDKVYYTQEKCEPSETYIEDEIRMVYKNITKVINVLEPVLYNLEYFGQEYNKAMNLLEEVVEANRHLKSELQLKTLRCEELESQIKDDQLRIKKISNRMKSLKDVSEQANLKYYVASVISFVCLIGFGYQTLFA